MTATDPPSEQGTTETNDSKDEKQSNDEKESEEKSETTEPNDSNDKEESNDEKESEEKSENDTGDSSVTVPNRGNPEPSPIEQNAPMEDAAKENKSKENEGDSKDQKETSDKKREPLPPPPRPIKKARTAYFIFADDKRAEFQTAHPGEGVGVLARLTGQAWSTLSQQDKAAYQNRAAEERLRVAKELEEYRQKYGDVPLEETPTSDSLDLPVARIRKIAKLDPDVKGMSKEACLLITKCTELALLKLGKETCAVANLQNRRKLLPDDVAQVCASREQFLFLRQDVKDLICEQKQEHQKQQQNKKHVQAAVSNSKPLTAYFGKNN